MCVAYCHRRCLLFWDHEDCHPADCEFARGPHASCDICLYRDHDICLLTRSPRPGPGGCCHCNVALDQGVRRVTEEMLCLLHLAPDESLESVLAGWNVPYHFGHDRHVVLLDPDELPVPQTYGLGTDHRADEEFDWSEWLEQWRQDVEPEAGS